MSALSPAPIDRSLDPAFRGDWNRRPRSWAAMRAIGRPFTASDIHSITGVPLGVTARLLIGWCKRGHLQQQPRGTSYTMTEKARQRTSPPQLKVKGSPSVKRRSGRQRMWSAMRVLRVFDLPTLMIAAGASASSARTYVEELRKAEYIGVAGSTIGGRTRFRLVRNSGVFHPVICRRLQGSVTVVELFDRNDNSVTHTRTIYPRSLRGKAPLKDGGVS